MTQPKERDEAAREVADEQLTEEQEAAEKGEHMPTNVREQDAAEETPTEEEQEAEAKARAEAKAQPQDKAEAKPADKAEAKPTQASQGRQ